MYGMETSRYSNLELCYFFVSTVLTCICVIIKDKGVNLTVTMVAITAAVLVAYLGVSACAVTALQLGLDQMPDASSDNIISFIKWFIFSALFGEWISEVVIRSTEVCLSDTLKMPHFLVSTQCLLSVFCAVVFFF